MVRVFAVKAYWKNTRRLRRELIVAADEKDAIKKVEEQGGYRIRTINENFNHLPSNHQLRNGNINLVLQLSFVIKFLKMMWNRW